MILTLILLLSILLFPADMLFAQQAAGDLAINLDNFRQPLEFSSTVNLLIAISSISIMPFLLISTTSFVRFAIVLGMLRQALGLNTSPPNQVIIALSMFLTVYVMSPTWTAVYDQAIINPTMKEQ